MNEVEADERVEELVAPLRAALDALLDADLSRLGSLDVAALLSGLEVQRRRLVAVDHRVLAEVEQRGVAGDFGRTSSVDLLVTGLHVAPGEARARVAQAVETRPTPLPSGEQVEAVLPRCADAVAAGEISAAHVSVIAKTLGRLPAGVAYEAWPVAEQLLVEAARHLHPGMVAQTGAMLLARVDPDGVAPREDELERRRGFTMIRNAAGGCRVTGEWTPEVTAYWDAILAVTAAPLPAGDGAPDDRSTAQRRHDAMGEAAARLLRSGELSSTDGLPVTVLLRTTLADLDVQGDVVRGPEVGRDGEGDARVDDGRGADSEVRTHAGTSPFVAGTVPSVGVAQTVSGDIWPMRRLRAVLGDAGVVPVVIDTRGAALLCGRTRRLATKAQRLALAVRDGGCAFPGCGRPAAWCEVHHVREWSDGGPTDIANLCFLCRFHHREFARRGWAVTMVDGVPQWTPPVWIDPHRRPLRNTAHHVPDLDFAVRFDDTG